MFKKLFRFFFPREKISLSEEIKDLLSRLQAGSCCRVTKEAVDDMPKETFEDIAGKAGVECTFDEESQSYVCLRKSEEGLT